MYIIMNKRNIKKINWHSKEAILALILRIQVKCQEALDFI